MRAEHCREEKKEEEIRAEERRKRSEQESARMAPVGGPASSPPLVKLASLPSSTDASRRVKINVGGHVFETFLGTIQLAGRGSRLLQSVTELPERQSEVFFDRDPDVFALILNVLRFGEIERPLEHVLRDRLIREATFYGVLDQIKAAMSAKPLDGLDVEKTPPILLNGVDFPSALEAHSDGSLWVGHGSKITAYDWAHRRWKTTVTELNSIQLMHALSDSHVVVGAEDFPGLHIYDVVKGVHSSSLTWVDSTDPRVFNPRVRAFTSNETEVFGSFESGQNLDNTILVVDKQNFTVVREIARQNGITAHSKAATKLQWLPKINALLVGSSHGGAFGYSGYVRLWDLRSPQPLCDWEEPQSQNPRAEQQDVFADLVANDDLSLVFKVGIKSGAISMADLRKIKQKDPWLPLIETNPELEITPGGVDNKLLAYNEQLYVSRGGSLEVWSEVPLADSLKDPEEKEYWETSFRRNYVDHRKHVTDPIIQLAVGGNRLFVARKDHQVVEVWETKRSRE